MEKIIINEAMIEKAESYVPINTKADFVDHCELGCLRQLNLSVGGEKDNPLPYMFVEDPFAKSRYLMTAFAVLYLGIPMREIPTESGDIWMMTEAEYDRWAGSHVFNQLERLKKVPELNAKIFDILRDYRDLEKKLSSVVYSSIQVRNDVCNRLIEKVTMDLSQENLNKWKKEVEGVNAELTKRGITIDPETAVQPEDSSAPADA